MNTEDIAARFDDRAGFRLVDYAEVGLPLYRLHAIAVLLANKKLFPIEEYVVRAMAAGLLELEEISEFLGLGKEVIAATLSRLIRADLVYQKADRSLELTPSGKSAVSESVSVKPVEQMVAFVVDGLTRKPRLITDLPVFFPAELKKEGIKLIRAFPARPPEPEELNVNDVEDALVWGDRGIGRGDTKLIRLRRVVRRQRIYLKGLALVYRAERSEEIQVSFAIDGRRSEDHELAFSRAQGPERLGIAKDVLESSRRRLREGVEGEITGGGEAGKAGYAEVDRLKRSAAISKFKAEIAERRLGEARSEEDRKVVARERDSALEKAERLEKQLDDVSVRPIAVYEHPKILREALLSAESRLLIMSPWITPAVVDRGFVKRLEELLGAGVNVFIGYGLDDKRQGGGAGGNAAEGALSALASRFSNFRFVRLGDTHAKVLIKDSDFYVTTSFNWLSFRGDPNRTFREEWGTKVSIADAVDTYFEELIKRFGE